MRHSFSPFPRIRIGIGIWLVPVPFICLYICLTRSGYINGERMATAFFHIFRSLAYLFFLAGESIRRSEASVNKDSPGWG